MTRHLLDGLLGHAMQRGNETALDCSGESGMTWRQLAIAVDLVAQSLQTQIADVRNTRVVYENGNRMVDVLLSLACAALGAIEIPIDRQLPGATRRELIQRSRGFFIDPRGLMESGSTSGFEKAIERLQQRSDRVETDRPSLVLWTSGTAAHPQGVMLSQRNLTSNAQGKLTAVPQSSREKRLTLLSLAHAYARTCDMGTWLLSGCRWTLDYGSSALDRIEPDRLPTMINCVPVLAERILRRLDENDLRLSRLRVLGCGGAALDAERYERLIAHGVDVIQGYGCTETSPVICSSSPGKTQAGYVGSPIDGCETRVVDQRLFVRGPLVMLGYLDNPAATQTKIDIDGWLDTGDLVEMDRSGQLRILGRADDVIVLPNGFKVHPTALEQSLVGEFGLAQVAVTGIAGSVAVGIYDERPIDEDRIAAFSRSSLPPGTRLSVLGLQSPLTLARGELTAKGTVRRNAVRTRLIGEFPQIAVWVFLSDEP